MSSHNKPNSLPGNVKIKVEPGTSSGYTHTLDENVRIKLEPDSSTRLTTLKLPRDLKLGGSKAKVFKPNLNVTRNKRNDITSSTSGPNVRGRGKGRGRGGDRGRGAMRGRGNKTLVQSQGIFSDGIANNAVKRASVYSDRLREDKEYDASKVMDKPTINKNVEWKVNKEHEDLILNELLNITSDSNRMDIDNDTHPVVLPINRDEDDRKPSFKLENIIKLEEKPLENGSNEHKLFEIQEKLLLFQFPDCLPGIGPIIEPEPKATTSTSTDPNAEPEKKQPATKCTLRDVNEGLLGKIVIYKSGKTKLVIGRSNFDIEMGPESGFLQDVMSVPLNTDTKTGDMINLGSLEGNLIVSPEWDNLLPP